MKKKNTSNPASDQRRTGWLKIIITVLLIEKVIQHTVVTLAFYFDWGGIRSTVAVNPDILMVVGGLIGVLFALSLWGLINQRKWAIDLVIGLALFDFFGEYVAQGTVWIVITVSFLVAILLFGLALFYRRQEREKSGSYPLQS